MLINFSDLSAAQIYFAMTQTIIPRPIAWVLSENKNQSINLAPFSYFNAVCSDPPLLMLSIGKKPDGSIKDTRRNICEREHFVVHIPSAKQVQEVSESSRTLPEGESELDRIDAETVALGNFPLPRIKACPIAFACRKFDVIELGPEKQALILGRIEMAYISESVAHRNAKGRLIINADKIDPLMRLGGSEYAALGEILNVPRPD